MSVGMKDLQTALGDNAEKVTMHIEDSNIVVETVGFLDTKTFGEIAEVLKQYGGQYHRAEEGGRFAKKFTVPITPTSQVVKTPQTPTPQPQNVVEGELQDIVDQLERLLTRLRRLAY